MRKTKDQRAITLIALIISVAVLLILAGVAISQVRENGLLGTTKNSQEGYEIEQEKEAIRLGYLKYKMLKDQGNNGNLTVEGAISVTGNETDGWIIKFQKRTYKLKDNGEIIGGDDFPPPIPPNNEKVSLYVSSIDGGGLIVYKDEVTGVLTNAKDETKPDNIIMIPFITGKIKEYTDDSGKIYKNAVYLGQRLTGYISEDGNEYKGFDEGSIIYTKIEFPKFNISGIKYNFTYSNSSDINDGYWVVDEQNGKVTLGTNYGGIDLQCLVYPINTINNNFTAKMSNGTVIKDYTGKNVIFVKDINTEPSDKSVPLGYIDGNKFIPFNDINIESYDSTGMPTSFSSLKEDNMRIGIKEIETQEGLEWMIPTKSERDSLGGDGDLAYSENGNYAMAQILEDEEIIFIVFSNNTDAYCICSEDFSPEEGIELKKGIRYHVVINNNGEIKSVEQYTGGLPSEFKTFDQVYSESYLNRIIANF